MVYFISNPGLYFIVSPLIKTRSGPRQLQAFYYYSHIGRKGSNNPIHSRLNHAPLPDAQGRQFASINDT